MGKVTREELIASATGADTATITVKTSAVIYLIDSANIASDTIPIKIIEPDGTVGGQVAFNGTSYQLDSSNTALLIKGPAHYYIDKNTTGSVGVGASILD